MWTVVGATAFCVAAHEGGPIPSFAGAGKGALSREQGLNLIVKSRSTVYSWWQSIVGKKQGLAAIFSLPAWRLRPDHTNYQTVRKQNVLKQD